MLFKGIENHSKMIKFPSDLLLYQNASHLFRWITLPIYLKLWAVHTMTRPNKTITCPFYMISSFFNCAIVFDPIFFSLASIFQVWTHRIDLYWIFTVWEIAKVIKHLLPYNSFLPYICILLQSELSNFSAIQLLFTTSR